MLGPALTELLHMLAATPERTAKQNALFEELSLLLASSAEQQGQGQAVLGMEIRSHLRIDDLGIFGVTRPKPKAAGSGICQCCGQLLERKPL